MARASKNIFLQVLWTGVDSSVPSLFLFTDTKRYIFNCGEGMQRLFTERRLKIGKLDTFFLTRYQWSHMGGLPGFGMTLRDARRNNPKEETKDIHIKPKGQQNKKGQLKGFKPCNNSGAVHIHAPQGMYRVISATKHFMRFDTTGVHFNVIEHGLDQSKYSSYKDEEMIVHPIPIFKNAGTSNQQYYSSEDIINTINITPKFPPPVLCYACHVNPIPGRFVKEKADALGIPRSGLRGKLTKGEAVTLPDGRTITPDQVVEPQQPGPTFLIVDCPSSEYFGNLMSNHQLETYTCKNSKKVPDLVIHLTQKDVYHNSEYQGWIKRFPSESKHIFLDPLLQKKVPFEGQSNHQMMLNLIDSKFFPEIADQNKIDSSQADITDIPMNFSKINLRESVGKTSGFIDNSDAVSTYRKSKLLNNAKELLNNKSVDRQLNNQATTISGNEKENIEIDSVSETVQNDNAIYIDITEQGVHNEVTPVTEEQYLCNDNTSNHQDQNIHAKIEQTISKDDKEMSEGFSEYTKSEKKSYEKLQSCNGKRPLSNLDEPVSNKKIALEECSSDIIESFPKVISLGTGAAIPSKSRNVSGTLVHLNSDDAILFDCGEDTFGQLQRHYGDVTLNVLSKLKMIFISHMHADHHLGTITLLKHYETIHKETKEPLLIIAPHLLSNWLSQYAETSEKLHFRFVDCANILDGEHLKNHICVQAVKVRHPASAHGFVVKYGKEKITYSGDTSPCDQLILAGQESTLLIHEATLEDEMVEEAAKKNHCTVSQALEVAQKMKAHNVLLTHISQRYPKIPIVKNTNLQKHVAFAFDHMETTLEDIPRFHELLPKLSLLFGKDEDQDD